MASIRNDGPVELIVAFDALGRHMIRGWSPDHASAARPGQRGKHPRKLHTEAWQVLIELSRYVREGILPVYPRNRISACERIPPSTVWLIYPLYPASQPSARNSGLIDFGNGTMIEAVADITEFRRELDRRPRLPRMGRPYKYPDYFAAAKAFWHANPGIVKIGVVIAHIKSAAPEIHEFVPNATRYRLIEKARVAARRVG